MFRWHCISFLLWIDDTDVAELSFNEDLQIYSHCNTSPQTFSVYYVNTKFLKTLFLALQDIQYSDIDYMDRQLDFTINETTYSGLEDFVRDLKATHSMKYDRTSHIQILSVLLVRLIRVLLNNGFRPISHPNLQPRASQKRSLNCPDMSQRYY